MNDKRKFYRLGWVAGVVWNDGGEWLYAKNDLAALWDRGDKTKQATIFPNKELAIKHAQKRQSSLPKFVREYFLESTREHDLPLVESFKREYVN